MGHRGILPETHVETHVVGAVGAVIDRAQFAVSHKFLELENLKSPAPRLSVLRDIVRGHRPRLQHAQFPARPSSNGFMEATNHADDEKAVVYRP